MVADDENLIALRRMVERWCDERKFDALSRLLPGYLSLNGLTDGWANLHDALKTTRMLGTEAFSASDWDLLGALIRWTEQIIRRR
jgi:hypothetical protein